MPTVAFASVEYIMRDVPWGWLIRYMHSTGASAFFVVVYLHMFRGLIYGSYRKPRELVWIFGCAIFLCLMAEAFMGYLLPWGQMSYWGAQVIVNLFSAIPFIGPDSGFADPWRLRGGRCHLEPFLQLPRDCGATGAVGLGGGAHHCAARSRLQQPRWRGNQRPECTQRCPRPSFGRYSIPPYYTVHDILGVSVFLMAFSAIVFFAPELGGYFLEYNNFIPADPLTTPLHIAPVWYFTPFYSMLRAITSEMMYALIACVVIGAYLAVSKGKLPTAAQGRCGRCCRGDRCADAGH